MSETIWRRDDANRIVIAQRAPLAAKLLGIPFAGVGGYLLWQVLGAIYDGARTAGLRGLLDALPGALLLLIFTAMFGLPGLVLLFGSKRSVIDGTMGAVSEVRDFVVMQRRSEYGRGELESVVLTDERLSDSSNPQRGSRRWVYHLSLTRPYGRERVLLSLHESQEEGRRLANDVAAALSLPLIDHSDTRIAPVREAFAEDDDAISA